MAAYTTTARIQSILGTAVLTEFVAVTGVDVTTTIAEASDFVGGYLRNNGYTVPTTTDPSTIADKTVCLATEALVVRKLCATPEKNLPLPEGWEEGMHQLALEGILSGSLTLNLERSTASSVGGWLAADTTSDVEDGGRPQRASREELSGF